MWCSSPSARPRGGATVMPTLAMSMPPRRRSRPTSAASPSRSEEHTSELQSLMRISYAVFCLKKKKEKQQITDFAEQKVHSVINLHSTQNKPTNDNHDTRH